MTDFEPENYYIDFSLYLLQILPELFQKPHIVFEHMADVVYVE